MPAVPPPGSAFNYIKTVNDYTVFATVFCPILTNYDRPALRHPTGVVMVGHIYYRPYIGYYRGPMEYRPCI